MFTVSLPETTEWLITAKWASVAVNVTTHRLSRSCILSKLVKLTAVTQCGKFTLTQTPPAQRILQRLFFFPSGAFYPQSCDCNVKPLTGKHRRTTLSARRQRMLRLRGTEQAASPEDGRVPGNKQTTATRQTPRIKEDYKQRLKNGVGQPWSYPSAAA